MNREALIEELSKAQSLLLALAEDVDEATFRTQYHSDLSPLGWHLGHCVYTDCLWLHETIRGDDSVTAPIADFYTPPNTPKSERGRLLPPQTALLTWARELQHFNLHYLRNLPAGCRRHPLLEDDYILHFLIQHNSQHYETMVMVLTQKALVEEQRLEPPPAPLQAAEVRRDCASIAAGQYRVGGQRPIACDNEMPAQRAELGPFDISRYPVSNAEYLGFIEDGGYRRAALWDAAGWSWREQQQIQHPDHWRLSRTHGWYATGIRGAYQLAADQHVPDIRRSGGEDEVRERIVERDRVGPVDGDAHNVGLLALGAKPLGQRHRRQGIRPLRVDPHPQLASRQAAPNPGPGKKGGQCGTGVLGKAPQGRSAP